MDVRVMRMRMPQRLMPVRMCMRFPAIPFEIVLVLMMRVVPMGMRMRHRFVHMFVIVRLGQV